MAVIIPKSVMPIFIKPLAYPGGMLTNRFSKALYASIGFRSFDINRDLDLIHSWTVSDYALPFWQFNISKAEFYRHYYNVQRSGQAHSFVGTFNDTPICQIDVYQAIYDEINRFTNFDPMDCGFHLLMAPNTSPVSGLTREVLKEFLSFFFSFSESAKMFAEPDVNNARSNRLLKMLGFDFRFQVLMSYKKANLYSISKQTFHEKNSLD